MDDPRQVLAHPSKQQRPLPGQSQSGSPTLQQLDSAEAQEETGGMAETSGHLETEVRGISVKTTLPGTERRGLDLG